MNKLQAFLAKNTIQIADNLPVVHSTRAYNLGALRENNILAVTPCDVFRGENLNYFFVARPAYKHSSDGEGAFWEFPACFIFDMKVLTDIRRIFPMDSGAFSRGMYPSYIKGMKLDHFSAGVTPEMPGRIISAFFGDVSRYLRAMPKGEDAFKEEHNLDAFDAEILALHRLSSEKGASTFDDRRMTIEIQNGSSIDMTVDHPLAVVAPSEYFEIEIFRQQVTEIWGAEPISYPVHSLSVQAAYGAIYDRVFNFYTQRNLLP